MFALIRVIINLITINIGYTKKIYIYITESDEIYILK